MMRKWLTILLTVLLATVMPLAAAEDAGFQGPMLPAAGNAAASETNDATDPSQLFMDSQSEPNSSGAGAALDQAGGASSADLTSDAQPLSDFENLESSIGGSFATRTSQNIFAALPDGEESALVRISREGGSPALVERATKISELVPLEDDLYYLREADGVTTLNRRAADGTVSTVYTFDAGTNPHNLCSFGGNLYLLISDQIHVIYPGNGLCLKLVGDPMKEFVIIGDYAYFVSMNDMMTYEGTSLLGDSTLTIDGGCLYRLNMTTGNTSLLVKTGIEDLRYADGKLFFHNLSDNYVMGSGESEWLEGRLYSFNFDTETLEQLLQDYDWSFFPSSEGFAVYTADAISYYPNDGEKKPLYVPESYLLVSGDDDGLITYEQAQNKMLLIYYDGTIADVTEGDLSRPTPLPDGTTPEPSVTPATSATPDPSATPGPSSTPGATGSNTGSTGGNTGSTGSNTGSTGGNTGSTGSSTGSSGGSSGGSSSRPSGGTSGGSSGGSSRPSGGSSSGGSSSGGSSGGNSGASQGTDPSYLIADSSSRKLTEDDVRSIDSSLWPYARNEIYARHGYTFSNSTYKNYFSKKSWYKPGGFSEDSLSDIEWYNMNLIKRMEEE